MISPNAFKPYNSTVYYEFKFTDGYIHETANQPRIPKDKFIELIKAHGRYIGARRWKYWYLGSGYHEKHYF